MSQGVIVAETFGQLVFRRRETVQRWKQKELAKRTGLDQSTISSIEHDQGTPRAATISLLARELGFDATPWLVKFGHIAEPVAPAVVFDALQEAATPDDAILDDLLAQLRDHAPLEAMDVLRELREIESPDAYRAAVKALAEAFAANMKMGGKMLRIKHPGRE